jgi:UDP-4-amino-4,6-dideoxy-N-acetyl-beta-L-altrosamine N-acetyltransferase
MLNNTFSLSRIKLRPLAKDDLTMVLNWRNSKSVRQFMLSDKLITIDEHLKWFDKVSNNKSCENLVVEYDNNPIGCIYIQDINPTDKTCTWGMYIGESNVNLGIGTLLEISAIDRMFYFHKVRKIWGQALISNRIRFLHYKMGFTDEGILKQHVYRHSSYEDVVIFSLFFNKWNMKRSAILEGLGILDC